MIQLKLCTTNKDYALALNITRAYIKWLDMDLSFQDIDTELATFDKMYGNPDGMFVLCFVQGMLAGGVGLRNLGEGVCEMKRLYVYGKYKNHGVGKALCVEIIRRAKLLGYRSMRLDTLERMHVARSLYKGLGFEEIEAYRFNPDPSARYMELRI